MFGPGDIRVNERQNSFGRSPRMSRAAFGDVGKMAVST
jgi:hypothetical protein